MNGRWWERVRTFLNGVNMFLPSLTHPFPRYFLFQKGEVSWVPRESVYLVDPASSHMLVSKIKPCKCQHMPPNG